VSEVVLFDITDVYSVGVDFWFSPRCYEGVTASLIQWMTAMFLRVLS
jgi:hypothetical protein